MDEDFYTNHVFKLPKTTKLNNNIVEGLDAVFDHASALEYRETLLEIYNYYILNEHESLPSNFKDMAGNMIMLLEFLKKVGFES